MFKTLAKWAAICAIALALVLGGSAIGRAFAQNPEPTAQPAKPATAAQPTDPGAAAQPNHPGRGRGGRNPGKGAQAGKGLKKALLKQTVALTGLERQDVAQQLRAGGTLSAIASANGSTEQAVIDAALAEITTRLDTAVASGRITEAEKTALLAKARENAPALMNETGSAPAGPGGRGGQRGQRAGRQLLVQATAEVTGLTAAEVRAEVQAGKSLEQVAQAHGKTADDVIAALRTRGEEKLSQQLERAREALTKVPGK